MFTWNKRSLQEFNLLYHYNINMYLHGDDVDSTTWLTVVLRKYMNMNEWHSLVDLENGI